MGPAANPAVVMQRSQTVLTELRNPGLQIRCLYSPHATLPPSRPRGKHACKCRASRGDDSKIPVVDDATVLPPPPTGSQYAWRRSWAGSGSATSSGSGGNGGTGGRSQARTKDWGRGPHSSLLFFLMYRIRMLLLYGAWVTVLYGAVRAVCDLSAKIGQGVMYVAGKAPGLGSAHLQRKGSTSEVVVPDTGAAADVLSAAVACEDSATAVSAIADDFQSADVAAAAAAAAGLPADSGSSGGSSSSSSSGSSSRFASINAYLQDRPTARVFSDLMTCVIPLYLILLGSVVFFSSM